MTPILFPYTYVSQSLAADLNRWFDTVAVYQPAVELVPEDMRRWCENSGLRLRFPAQNQDSQLIRILEDFHRWSSLQKDRRGIGAAYRKALEGGPPFFESELPSHIRADIKRRISGSEIDDETGRDLFQARIFLAIAQELDRQADTLQSDLVRLADMERLLMESMHEPEEAAAALSSGRTGKIAGRREERDYMFEERLAAWSRLLRADAQLRDSEALAVFIAPGQTAVDAVRDAYPEALRASIATTPPAGGAERRALQEQLAELCRSRRTISPPPPSETALEADAMVARVLPEVSPFTAFARLAGRPELESAAAGLFPSSRNTVIVSIP